MKRLSSLELEEANSNITVQGRITTVRKHKKSLFLDLNDGQAQMQTIMARELYNKTPIKEGDIVEISGVLTNSNTGQKSIKVSKSLLLNRPINYQGENTRTIQLLKDREALENLVYRELAIRATKVDSSLFSRFAGTSKIVPFKTTSQDGEDYFLRFTMELELKKLVARTQMPVFEIGKVFRNLGTSSTKVVEYKSMEAYFPYTSLEEGMDICEKILIKSANLFNIELPQIQRVAAIQGIDSNSLESKAHYDSLRKASNPTWVLNPSANWVSPLYVQINGLAREGKLCWKGLGTIFQASEENSNYNEISSALNDQLAQLRTLGKHSQIDTSFLKELEQGLPPCTGIYLGMDRLLAALKDKRNIREVIPFPV